jgi:hypothetical protein
VAQRVHEGALMTSRPAFGPSTTERVELDEAPEPEPEPEPEPTNDPA